MKVPSRRPALPLLAASAWMTLEPAFLPRGDLTEHRSEIRKSGLLAENTVRVH